MFGLDQIRGVYCPVLTPLTPDEHIDHVSLGRLVDFVVTGGIDGVWAMGTTAEFAAFTEQERAAAVETTIQAVAGRVPVIANIGDASTRLALRHARHAVDAGADAVALTPPYYFHHTMDEVLTHFRIVKEAFPDRPLLIYNIPQTVKVKMALATTLQLAREGTAQGIKDSQNDLRWFRALAAGIRGEGLSEQFRLFLGTRTLVDAAVVVGAQGAIPATSNVVPDACVRAFHCAESGDFATALREQERVIWYEDLALLAANGSADASSYASMKQILVDRGIIAHATLTQPLRAFAESEVAALRGAIQKQEPIAVA